MVVGLGIVFIVCLAFTTRGQTEKIAATLAFNALVIIAAAAALLLGAGVMAVSAASMMGMLLLTLFYQNGVNAKTKAVFIAMLVVIAVMAVCVWWVCRRAGIYGLNERTWEEDEILMMNLHLRIDMLAVGVFVMLMGLLGAAKDSAMAVASGTFEVMRCHPGMSRAAIVRSGMAIGRDVLGITINTLFFAAIGESLLLVQLYFDCHYSLGALLNAKSLFQAAMPVLVGGIGVELSIPVTAAVMAVYGVRKIRQSAESEAPGEGLSAG
ncbi:YibE/F family protein [Pseudoramibacter alactolyticus]|jgi:uncharacterized membrane protein|uniref:YibE/F family protein n=1 Tax=Pseudoramibacter alactolyticus TaxID=113287 RepID=UPI0023552CBD|nr:YibE/F family protein [Pseudoramibacter alactolyticus]MBM6969058.1 YibE/F family protein [Pseudoramibacter alactolyticus]